MNYLFYSKYSDVSKQFMTRLGDNIREYKLVCIDSPSIREKIQNSSNVTINTVPCIIFVRESGDHYSVQKYEYPELENLVSAISPPYSHGQTTQTQNNHINSEPSNEGLEILDDALPLDMSQQKEVHNKRDFIDKNQPPPPDSGGGAPVPPTTDLTRDDDIPISSNQSMSMVVNNGKNKSRSIRELASQMAEGRGL